MCKARWVQTLQSRSRRRSCLESSRKGRLRWQFNGRASSVSLSVTEQCHCVRTFSVGCRLNHGQSPSVLSPPFRSEKRMELELENVGSLKNLNKVFFPLQTSSPPLFFFTPVGDSCTKSHVTSVLLLKAHFCRMLHRSWVADCWPLA